MKNLLISETKLEERRQELPRRLRKYIPNVPFITADYQQLGPNAKVIGIHQGWNRDQSYQYWRVNLSEYKISIGYYEIWQYLKVRNRPNSYLLQKAYFHVYLPHPSGREKKLIFLHCDPQEPEDTKHHRFKIAPHTHFEIAGDPWGRVHVPLCDGYQDQVLKNVGTIDKALSRGIEFIIEQICPLTKEIDLSKYFGL